MSPVPARSAPVAVIAGACGGIGRAVAQHLAADGMRLALWDINACLLYTSPSPRDKRQSRMPSSA